MADEAKAASELIEYIAKAITTEPDEVSVVANGQTLELETASGDRGRVIGRQGRIAKAMRAVLAASATGPGYRLDIVD